MCELLERARKAQGDISYYEVAKRLGISTPLMNKWKNNKSQPNGINTLMLADMAGVTPKEALKIMQGGFSDVSLLIVTGLLCNAGLAYSLISKFCILCKIKFTKKVEFEGLDYLKVFAQRLPMFSCNSLNIYK
jgi:hypothetical protein